MEKWIIIEMRNDTDFPISHIDGFVVLNEEGNVAIFSSLDEAGEYQEENQIDGRCVELPIY